MPIERQIERIKKLSEGQEQNPEILKIEKSLIDHVCLMEDILQSVPNSIGVIRPNFSIVFFNQRGHFYFRKTDAEMRKLRCFELFNRKEKCEFCRMEEVFSEKKEILFEAFVNELGKYIEFFYRPILDKNGEIDIIIVRMRDITDQKVYEKKLKIQEKSFRQLFEFSPNGIVIIQDGKISMANTEICKLLGYKEKELLETPLSAIIHKDYQTRVERNRRALYSDSVLKIETELVLVRKDGRLVNVNMIAGKTDFFGNPASQIIVRDISKEKAEMDKAAKIQQVRMENYPVDLERINLETVYIPKHMVSGDFFHIFRTGENEMLGFLGDSNGSGVTAALLNSAVKVILNDLITKTTHPETLLNMINAEFQSLFEEDFISAISFKIDFESQKIIITSAGINEYIIQRKGSPTLSLLKGPPIGGKIGEASFDTIVHDFQPGDRIYLFTDGYGDKIQDKVFKEKIYKNTLAEQKEYIKDYFLKPDKMIDDVLWVAIESLLYPEFA